MNEPIKTITVRDELKIGSELVAERISSDGSKALRVSERETSAWADMDQVIPIRFGTQGEPRRGERDSIKVCSILIERLNSDGASWGTPKQPEGLEEGVDGVAHDVRDPSTKPLRIQVTRSLARTKYWAELDRSKQLGVQRTGSEENLATDLFNAIQRKKNHRKDVVLALNAIFTPGHAFVPVVTVFHSRYLRAVQSLGFEAIWIVGPTARYTAQLDID